MNEVEEEINVAAAETKKPTSDHTALHQLDHRILVYANLKVYNYIRDHESGDQNCMTPLGNTTLIEEMEKDVITGFTGVSGAGQLEKICSLVNLSTETVSLSDIRKLLWKAISTYSPGAKESEEIYTIYCVNLQAKEGEDYIKSRSYPRPKKLPL